MAIDRRSFATLAASLLNTGFWAPAFAQSDYPSRPIKVIIPSAAGGPGDLMVRTIAAKVGELLGQSLVAENRTGAAGTIGVGAVAKSAADGYTMLLVSTTHSATEALYPNRGYVLLRDLAPVSPITLTPSMLAVNPAVPANSVQELVALARRSPGKLTYASAGVGNIFHLTGELFAKATGVQLTHVPYSQSGAARTDLAAGQVDMMFDAVPTMQPLVQAGKVRALATTGARRSPALPNLPTLIESGYPGLEVDTWTGFLVPAGTPEPVLAKLHDAVQRALRDKGVLAAFAQQGAEPILESREQFGQRVKASVEQWDRLIKETGIKAE